MSLDLILDVLCPPRGGYALIFSVFSVSNAVFRIKHLDVFNDHLPDLLTCSKAVVMQTFRFDRAKEALGKIAFARLIPTSRMQIAL